MAQDWDIRPRGHSCRGCEQVFSDGQACHSALTFDDGGYTRSDYCAACWDVRQTQGPMVSVWQSVYQAPPPKAEEPVKKETAETLLRRFIEDTDTDRRGVMFILAVMLERNKTLIERHVQPREDGAISRVYEHRQTGETFVIIDPRLRLDELDAVQEEVVVLLGGKPREPKAAPAGETEPTAPPALATEAAPAPVETAG